MVTRVRRVGIITSGGDSPGFNPFVRAVVRMALYYGWEPWGIQRGYEGLIAGDIELMNSRSVSGAIGMGGTILGSSRSEVFMTAHGIRDALRNLNEADIDAVAIIGGDGTMRGARALYEAGVPVIGAPGTIENDVCGTDVSIGVDTALNTALDAMDRIRDTASSQEQAFIIEMMGEKSGYLALMAGIAGGAEMVCIPEEPFTLDDVTREVADAYIRGKKHCIITVAEGARPSAREIADHLRAHEGETGFDVRLSLLGHIQRGGSPSAFDRFLATRLGAAAVERLLAGESGVIVGTIENEVVTTPLSEVTECTRHIDEEYLSLAKVLAR
ncbi:MAG TPA: 6-phosphofructokinase [Chloroflexi bacterium]|nr:6-phosphofructokinase [Chloroflexota bacterium]